MPLAVQKRPSPVQNSLCERERESGRGKGMDRKGLALFKMACVREIGRVGEGRGGKRAIDCPEKGTALFKVVCVRERGSGRGKGRDRKGLALFKMACVRERGRVGEGRGWTEK